MAHENTNAKGRKKTPAEIAQEDVSKGVVAERVRWVQLGAQGLVTLLVALVMYMLAGVRAGQERAEAERESMKQTTASLEVAMKLSAQQSKSDKDAAVAQSKADKEAILAEIGGFKTALVEYQRRQDLQIAELKVQLQQFESKIAVFQTDVTVLKTLLTPTNTPERPKIR